MAKKSKKPATRSTRRRRVSGVSSDFMKEVAGALVGYVGGKMLSSKLLPNLDDKIKGGALAAVGVLLVPKTISGAMGKGLSIGLAVAGGDLLLRSTGLIAGLNNPVMYLPYSAQRQINGAGISQTVSGNGIAETVGGGGIAQTVGNLRRRSRAEA